MEKTLQSIDKTLKQLLEIAQNNNKQLKNIQGDTGYLSFIDTYVEEIKEKIKK